MVYPVYNQFSANKCYLIQQRWCKGWPVNIFWFRAVTEGLLLGLYNANSEKTGHNIWVLNLPDG